MSQLAKALNRGAMWATLAYSAAIVLLSLEEGTRQLVVQVLGGLGAVAIWLYRKTR